VAWKLKAMAFSHLSVYKPLGSHAGINGGNSYYLNGVFPEASKIFQMAGNSFTINENDPAGYVKREYPGADIQIEFSSCMGKTVLSGEYIFGTQPGGKGNSNPDYSEISERDIYIRNFRRGYLNLIQDFVKSGLSAVTKFDFYDPNAKNPKKETGIGGTGKGDIAWNTFGTGILCYINRDIRLTVYNDWLQNETSANLSGYDRGIADNVFTLRVQYSFYKQLN
jgi:hypothetical protein